MSQHYHTKPHFHKNEKDACSFALVLKDDNLAANR